MATVTQPQEKKATIRDLPRNVWAVSLTSFFMDISSEMVINILPLPPLDGGRMLVIVLKSLFGSRISARAERLTYVVGFAFLFAFLIWVSGFDLLRSLGWVQ